MQEVVAKAKDMTKPLNSFLKQSKDKVQTLPLHKKKFKYKGTEKFDWKSFDFPSLD